VNSVAKLSFAPTKNSDKVAQSRRAESSEGANLRGQTVILRRAWLLLFEKQEPGAGVLSRHSSEDVLKVEASKKLCQSSNHDPNHRNVNESLRSFG
jgi:hypothetical protein